MQRINLFCIYIIYKLNHSYEENYPFNRIHYPFSRRM